MTTRLLGGTLFTVTSVLQSEYLKPNGLCELILSAFCNPPTHDSPSFLLFAFQLLQHEPGLALALLALLDTKNKGRTIFVLFPAYFDVLGAVTDFNQRILTPGNPVRCPLDIFIRRPLERP